MAAYGYDGRHLFKYDKDITYEGVTTLPPTQGVTLVGNDEKMAARFTGSYFLSGRRDPAFNVWVDGDRTAFVMSYWKNGTIQHGTINTPSAISHIVPICINGPIVKSHKLAEFCRSFPSSSVFVCPIDGELAALGALVKEMPPRRAFIPSPQTDELDYEAIEYDPKLEGDRYGRMADLVANGMAVYNNIYSGPGGWPFYGSILTKQPHPDVEMFIVRSEAAANYFPTDPISAKMYAATTRPVMMTPSKEFRQETGCRQPTVDVIVSSDFIPGTTTFMNFYQTMSGRDWCALSLRELVKPVKTMPVFRYNKAYRLTPKQFAELLTHESF